MEACCPDGYCPQHLQMREMIYEEGYPILIPELRSKGWFRRRIEHYETPKVGGRAH